MHSPQRFWGLLTRKERWGLSWRGRLAAALLVLLAGRVLLLNIYPFLAVTQRVDAKVLVVEGWVPDRVIRMGIEEFKTGSYSRVFSTGGPVEWSGEYAADANTTAPWGAGRLRKGGIPKELVQMVPSHLIGRDRTYNSAAALRDWFRAHNIAVDAVTVVTKDVHARRTRLLFQEAFGDGVTVGIIAVPNPDYDATHWWRYSEGVRDVVGEGLAYLYAKFLFFPSKS